MDLDKLMNLLEAEIEIKDLDLVECSGGPAWYIKTEELKPVMDNQRSTDLRQCEPQARDPIFQDPLIDQAEKTINVWHFKDGRKMRDNGEYYKYAGKVWEYIKKVD